MATRGRKAGFIMSEEHRTKIANSQILNRLIACAVGEIEMGSTQASVALGLLKKVMPDLAQTDINANVDTHITGVRWLTEAEQSQSSLTVPDPNSDSSTTEANDGPSSSPIDEPEKQ